MVTAPIAGNLRGFNGAAASQPRSFQTPLIAVISSRLSFNGAAASQPRSYASARTAGWLSTNASMGPRLLSRGVVSMMI